MKLKKSWLYVGAGILVLALIAFFALRGDNSHSNEDILNINLREHTNLALHIHPHLSMTINGQEYPVPANIGISPSGMRVIHTHEPDGNLHVEAPTPHQFYLGDFFEIWGKRFTKECIFEFCEDAEHDLRFYVNGQETDLGPDIPLYDLDQIEIVYGVREDQ